MTRSYHTFSHAHEASSTQAIPEGFVGKARLTLYPQDDNDGDHRFYQQTAYGLDYLHAVFTLVNGDYAGYTIDQIIAIAINPQAAHCSPEQRQTMEGWIMSTRLLI